MRELKITFVREYKVKDEQGTEYRAGQQVTMNEASAHHFIHRGVAVLTDDHKKAEADKIAAEKAEADKIAAEKAEADKIAAEKAEADKHTSEKNKSGKK